MYRIIGADGKEYGPVSYDQIRRWISEGRANAETRVIAEGGAEWKRLAEFAEFSFAFPYAAVPSLAAMTSPPLFVPLPRTNSFAVTGFILGILSTLGFCCCYGFPFNLLGLTFSIIGLVQIKNNPTIYEGKGLAIAGLILSILGILLAIGVALVFTVGSVLSEPGFRTHRL
jgi:hypothetical protein